MRFTLIRWHTTGLDILVGYDFFDAVAYLRKHETTENAFLDWLNSHPPIGDEFRFNNNLYAFINLG